MGRTSKSKRCTTDLFTAYCRALRKNDPEILSQNMLMLKKIKPDFDINQVRSKEGYTIIEFAFINFKESAMDLPLIEILIDNGADPNIPFQDGQAYPLHRACVLSSNAPGATEIVRCLIQRGKADVNVEYINGAFPLGIAAFRGNAEVVKVLLDNGANPYLLHGTFEDPDFAESDKIKKMIHKAMRDKDHKEDKAGSNCTWCGVSPENPSGLRRCGKCYVNMYCSEFCQKKDWKDGSHKQSCAGSCVVAMGMDDLVEMCRSNKNMVSESELRALEQYYQINAPMFLKGRQMIVKGKCVDLKIQKSGEAGLLGTLYSRVILHNSDKTIYGHVRTHEPGYATLRKLVETEFTRGKAVYLWAEVVGEQTFKVFPGKLIINQDW